MPEPSNGKPPRIIDSATKTAADPIATPTERQRRQQTRPPDWRLPTGVAPGTWDYVHSSSIADDYETFLQGTDLASVDLAVVASILPLASSQGAIVADLGCGTGRTRQLVHDKGYRLLGIDLSQPMLSQFKKRNMLDDVERPNTELADAKLADEKSAGGSDWALRANLVELDCVRDAAVDHALCLFSTLGMIRGRKNRRQALLHFFRILRPGGKLILHAHNRWAATRDPGGLSHLVASWLRSLRDPEFDFGDRVYGYRGLPNMFLHSYGRSELLRDLRLAGFTACQIIPLTVRGDGQLSGRWFASGLRAGGFMVSAERKPDT